MRKGGFRLRLGRSRNTGFAAAGLHPATMHILGDFLAVGNQMKTERPGKAAGIVPVDSIEGPTVRLKDGSVLRVDDAALAREIVLKIEKILDVGEILDQLTASSLRTTTCWSRWPTVKSGGYRKGEKSGLGMGWKR